MSKLTWADVAHYYSESRPEVWLPSEGRKYGHHANGERYEDYPNGYWRYDYNDLPSVLEKHLPILADLSKITEEDAKGVLDACGVSLEGVSVTALRFLNESMADAKVGDNHTVLTLALGRPEVFHYLISRNYNVFGIETWKGVQP